METSTKVCTRYSGRHSCPALQVCANVHSARRGQSAIVFFFYTPAHSSAPKLADEQRSCIIHSFILTCKDPRDPRLPYEKIFPKPLFILRHYCVFQLVSSTTSRRFDALTLPSSLAFTDSQDARLASGQTQRPPNSLADTLQQTRIMSSSQRLNTDVPDATAGISQASLASEAALAPHSVPAEERTRTFVDSNTSRQDETHSDLHFQGLR